ncbi:hypothetical protein [Kitasatospora purpeofusca]|uniref:hypothetical protein n=1 Tax=Kitasatospora purpeofusca TaxID=67352 RepID=UPI0035DC97F4
MRDEKQGERSSDGTVTVGVEDGAVERIPESESEVEPERVHERVQEPERVPGPVTRPV